MDLELILRRGRPIKVSCSRCGAYRELTMQDIEALAAKVGLDFTLDNRRCRCRLTPGCDGWNTFFHLSGVYRPIFSARQADIWFRKDYLEERAKIAAQDKEADKE